MMNTVLEHEQTHGHNIIPLIEARICLKTRIIFIKTTSRQSRISFLFHSRIHLTFFPLFFFSFIIFFESLWQILRSRQLISIGPEWFSVVQIPFCSRRYNIHNPKIPLPCVTFMIRIRIKLFVTTVIVIFAFENTCFQALTKSVRIFRLIKEHCQSFSIKSLNFPLGFISLVRSWKDN